MSCFKEFLLLLRNLDGDKGPTDTNKISHDEMVMSLQTKRRTEEKVPWRCRKGANS